MFINYLNYARLHVFYLLCPPERYRAQGCVGGVVCESALVAGVLGVGFVLGGGGWLGLCEWCESVC